MTEDHFYFDSFAGFTQPYYTPVPDELFDVIMARLSGAELKVLLYIFRHTFGYKKAIDAISFEQLVSGIVTAGGNRVDWGTGLSKDSVARALRGLTEKHLVIVEKRRKEGRQAVSRYGARFAEGTESSFLTQTIGHTINKTLQETPSTTNDKPPSGGSVSLAGQIGKRYGRNARDAKALTTSLSKHPEAALQWAAEALENGLGSIQNPAALLNAVVPRLAQELQERQREDMTRRQERLAMVRATAAFYAGVEDAAGVRERLLVDFGDAELVTEALG